MWVGCAEFDVYSTGSNDAGRWSLTEDGMWSTTREDVSEATLICGQRVRSTQQRLTHETYRVGSFKLQLTRLPLMTSSVTFVPILGWRFGGSAWLSALGFFFHSKRTTVSRHGAFCALLDAYLQMPRSHGRVNVSATSRCQRCAVRRAACKAAAPRQAEASRGKQRQAVPCCSALAVEPSLRVSTQ